MRFSNFLNKALMGKPIMHSARALFLTFLALEKSKRNQCCPIKIGLYFLCPFVLIQKNEKIKSRLKPFGENLSATDTRKECTLWRTNVKRFSVSVPPLNFLLPHFANRDPDSTKPLSLFITFQFFERGKGLSLELRHYR
jgi:hypothetical protein